METIKQYCEKEGITQVELAEQTSYPLSTLYQYAHRGWMVRRTPNGPVLISPKDAVLLDSVVGGFING